MENYWSCFQLKELKHIHVRKEPHRISTVPSRHHYLTALQQQKVAAALPSTIDFLNEGGQVLKAVPPPLLKEEKLEGVWREIHHMACMATPQAATNMLHMEQTSWTLQGSNAPVRNSTSSVNLPIEPFQVWLENYFSTCWRCILSVKHFTQISQILTFFVRFYSMLNELLGK